MVKFRDDITARDGVKKDKLGQKGYWSSIISSKFFEVLEKTVIKTQYLEFITPVCTLSLKLEMIPIEVITIHTAAGSLLRRHPFEA